MSSSHSRDGAVHPTAVATGISMVLERLRRAASRLLRPRRRLPPGIEIGEDVFIGGEVYLDPAAGRLIRIDRQATLSAGAALLCHDPSSNRRLHVTWMAPIHICERAFIGYRALILPGVTVGADAIVAAHAVVSRDVPPGVVVAGVPARAICTTAQLDARRQAAVKKYRVFDSQVFNPVYNSTPLPAELEADIRDAAERDGGYFFSSHDA